LEILIVDNDRTNREEMARWLEFAFEGAVGIIFASDGKEGYEMALEEEELSVLVTELILDSQKSMGNIKNGPGLIQAVKEELSVPVILAISRHRKHGQEALDAGADRFFSGRDPSNKSLEVLVAEAIMELLWVG